MSEITGPTARVRDAAESFGLSVTLRIMPELARTAEEAASACGCSVGEIVKSLVFRARDTHRPLLFLVSGANRLDEAGVGAAIGEAIERPNAAFVREVTGFAIGGIPPFAHATPLATWIDRDLLAYRQVWAAAGTPHAVFAVDPAALAKAISAQTIAMAPPGERMPPPGDR